MWGGYSLGPREAVQEEAGRQEARCAQRGVLQEKVPAAGAEGSRGEGPREGVWIM